MIRELYRIVIGETVYTYTSSDAPIEHNGETYVPAPIGRSRIEQGEELNRANVTIRLPLDNPAAAEFVGGTPEQVTSVTLFRQRGPMTGVYWMGRVASAKPAGFEMQLDCESVATTLRRPGLRARYQRGCRHTLYRRGCRLNQDDFAIPATLDSVSGAVLTVPAAAGYPNGWFAGGMIELDGALRYILSHSGQTITLSRPLSGHLAGFDGAGYGRSWGMFYGGLGVTLYPGCDRTRSTCASKFSNHLNYGGFPWIPLKNPMGGSPIA